MKTVHSLVLISMILIPLQIFCQQENDSPEQSIRDAKLGNASPIVWDKTTYNYGEIPYRVPAEAIFIFLNSGKEPLTISNIHTSCGSTSTKYPEEPVMPGDSSRISVTYNAVRFGFFNKTISVFTNIDDEPVRLFVKGKVVQSDEEMSADDQDTMEE